MTVEEIRKKFQDDQVPDVHFDLQLQALGEIAAQLAEIKELLAKSSGKSIFEQVFGR